MCTSIRPSFLLQLKKEADSEAVKSEVVGQAYLEEVALKLFHAADENDREAKFNRFVSCLSRERNCLNVKHTVVCTWYIHIMSHLCT